jgi:hypothetical protein
MLLAVLGVGWNQIKGTPLTFTPFLGLFIAFCNLLVNGYYNAKLHEMDIDFQACVKAQPLIELKAQLVRELTEGQYRLMALKQQVANLETATTLASLDKEAIRALLQPSRKSIWIDRTFGFASGVTASLIASVLYELAKS